MLPNYSLQLSLMLGTAARALAPSNPMPAYPQLAHPVGFQSPFTLATHTDSAGYTLPALANLDSSVYLPIAAEDPSNDLGNPIAFSAHGQHTISATFNGTTLHLIPGTTSVNSATGIPFASTPQWVDLHFHTSNQAFVTVTLDNAVSRWAFNPTNGVLNQHRQYSIPKTTVRTITRNNNPYTYHIDPNRNMLAIADTSRSQMHRYPAPICSLLLASSCIENPAANGFAVTTITFDSDTVILSEFFLNSNLGYLDGFVRFIPLPTNIGYTKDATATLQRNGNMVAISLFEPNKGATQFIGQIGSDFSLTNLQKRTDSTATALVPLYVAADGTAVAEHDGTTITWDGTGAPPDGPLCNLQRERNINSYEVPMTVKTQEPLNTNNPGDPSHKTTIAATTPDQLPHYADYCIDRPTTNKPSAASTTRPTATNPQSPNNNIVIFSTIFTLVLFAAVGGAYAMSQREKKHTSTPKNEESPTTTINTQTHRRYGAALFVDVFSDGRGHTSVSGTNVFFSTSTANTI